MKQDYTPGEECQCSAYNESECGCGADWTPREVYELREQVKHLQSQIEGMGYRHSHLRCQIIQAENVTWRVKSRLQSVTEQRDRLEETLREEVTAHAKTIADLQDMGEQRDNLKIALEELEESRDCWRKAALNPHR